MPLRAARRGRVGVIGHPVAKTAVVAKAVTSDHAPVAKTAVVAAAVTPGRGVRGGGASDLSPQNLPLGAPKLSQAVARPGEGRNDSPRRERAPRPGV